jgi:SAM-dependent methyltransferase
VIVPAEQAGGQEARRRGIDTSVAHAARVYDYWLGGKDNFAADREAAEAAIAVYPGIVRAARANRAFLSRAVRYLALEAGIRQFLDVGTGIPAAGNTHEVAQAAAPQCRVVYVDHDPVVLSHAQALLQSGPQGATDYLDADLLDPAAILAGAASTLDLSRPVALMILSTLHLIPDEDDPYGAVHALARALAPGSFLAVSHGASDLDHGVAANMATSISPMMAEKVTARSRAQVALFFEGLELVEPGLVRITQWRSGSGMDSAAGASMWAGVARKPAPEPPGPGSPS